MALEMNNSQDLIKIDEDSVSDLVLYVGVVEPVSQELPCHVPPTLAQRLFLGPNDVLPDVLLFNTLGDWAVTWGKMVDETMTTTRWFSS